MTGRSAARFPAMAAALVALALGLWAGLALIGWSIPVPTAAFAGAHGILMVNGVLASLIGVERAVALRRRAFFLAPGLTAAGAVVLAWSGSAAIAEPLVLAGVLILALMFTVILRRQPALYTLVPVLGVLSLLAGDLLGWAGRDVPLLIPWWGSFLILITAAERLELTRILPLTSIGRASFAACIALVLGGSSLSVERFHDGFLLTAVGWFLLAAWLLSHDIAFRNLARPGLPRFTAIVLVGGYLWLLVGGGLIAFERGDLTGLLYDAGLHAVFLGFVLSLVFAHAPIIVPAVVGRPMRFHPILYGPVILLHASLAVRIAADVLVLPVVREWAGLVNVLAIVLFGGLIPGLVLAPSEPARPGPRSAAATGSSPF